MRKTSPQEPEERDRKERKEKDIDKMIYRDQ